VTKKESFKTLTAGPDATVGLVRVSRGAEAGRIDEKSNSEVKTF
jgi:hypothetical protein